MTMRLALLTIVTSLALPLQAEAQTSEFERFIQNRGRLPVPFAALLGFGAMERGAEPDENGLLQVDTVWVPSSRSLQREHASLARPRRIGGFGRTFIGFSEASHELEVISWNAAEGRFDFYLVRDYGLPDRTPRIERQPPDTNVCISCHQGGGPIFPGAPWTEMDGDAQHPVRERVIAARQAVRLPPIEAPVFSGAVRFQEHNTAATFFDSELRAAETTMLTCRIYRTACQDDLTCRKRMLLEALLRAVTPASRGTDDTAALIIRDRNREALYTLLETRWPPGGFRSILSRLPDRNPDIQPERGGRSIEVVVTDRMAAIRALSETVRPGSEVDRRFGFSRAEPTPNGPLLSRDAAENLISEDLSHGGTSPDFQSLDRVHLTQGLDGFEHREHFGFDGDSIANPARPRPETQPLRLTDFRDGLRSGFRIDLSSCLDTDTSSETASIREIPPRELEQIVLSSAFDRLVERWPPSVAEVRATINAVRMGRPQGPCPPETPLPTPPLPAATAVVEPLVGPTVQQNPNQLFQRYCARCHEGPLAVRALPLGRLPDLRDYNGGAVIDRLRGRGGPVMPPRSVPAHLQPSEEERAAMVRGLQLQP